MPPILNPNGPTNVIRYTGDPNVPYDFADLRANSLDLMRRMGTPVIIKHMFNPEDVENGIAVPSPNFNPVYKQTRGEDPISHGVGFVGIETSLNEWADPDGELVIGPTESPGPGYTPAPKYRGYGPGFLTYVILPDVAEDVYRPNEAGVLIRIQRAQVQMGWYPEVNDNDLIIIAEINDAEHVVATHERFLARATNPVSLHGYDQYGRREYSEDFGNRRIVNQQFEIDLLPVNHPLYGVETDR
jgi:hypothetical protein